MVIKDEARNEEAVWEPIPYLGRSVRVVGDWRSVDASQTPHEKNKRGELGKPLKNWYFNRTSCDPLGRIATANASADRRNAIESHIGGAPRGRINPVCTEVTDPQGYDRTHQARRQASGSVGRRHHARPPVVPVQRGTLP